MPTITWKYVTSYHYWDYYLQKTNTYIFASIIATKVNQRQHNCVKEHMIERCKKNSTSNSHASYCLQSTLVEPIMWENLHWKKEKHLGWKAMHSLLFAKQANCVIVWLYDGTNNCGLQHCWWLDGLWGQKWYAHIQTQHIFRSILPFYLCVSLSQAFWHIFHIRTQTCTYLQKNKGKC